MSIIIPILTEYNDAGVNKAQKSLKSLVTSNISATVAVTALVAASTKAVKAFNEDAKSQQLLALTLRNTTNATDAQIKATENYLGKLSMQAAVADDELRPALSSLLRITKDQDIAQRLLNDSLNLAATTQRPLEQVTLALGKAYQGNFKALKSMGFSISDATIKSKDFDAAMREIRPIIEGASAEAAKSADGGFKKLQIAFDELTESAGGKLSPVLEDLATIGSELATRTKDAEGNTNGWGNAIGFLVREIVPGVKGLQDFAFFTDKAATSLENAGNAATGSAAQFRQFDQLMMGKYKRSMIDASTVTDKVTNSKTKAKTAAEKLREKNKKLSDTLKTQLGDALDAAKDKVESLKDEASGLAASIRDQVTGFVSLSDAVSTAQSSEDKYNDALKNRADAYARLNALEAERKRRGFGANDQVTYDAEEYAQALLDVASAETAVSTAQANKVNYVQQFAADIAQAKAFAANLKHLVANGLQPAGLQQLLSLGPKAGLEVSNYLIAVPNGAAVGQLNADLNDLGSIGQGIGDIVGGNVFGGLIAGAQGDVNALGMARVVTNQNNVTIQVSSADPQAVVDALKKWMKANGSIPIRVNG
jgi:hypothetical protein